MKLISILILGLVLSSCSNTLLEQLELEEGENGSVCVRGTVDLNPVPLITSNATFVYKEHSDPDGIPPDC